MYRVLSFAQHRPKWIGLLIRSTALSLKRSSRNKQQSNHRLLGPDTIDASTPTPLHPVYPQLLGSLSLEVSSSRRSRRQTRTPSSSCLDGRFSRPTTAPGCTSPLMIGRRGEEAGKKGKASRRVWDPLLSFDIWLTKAGLWGAYISISSSVCALTPSLSFVQYKTSTYCTVANRAGRLLVLCAAGRRVSNLQ